MSYYAAGGYYHAGGYYRAGGFFSKLGHFLGKAAPIVASFIPGASAYIETAKGLRDMVTGGSSVSAAAAVAGSRPGTPGNWAHAHMRRRSRYRRGRRRRY